MWRTLALIYGAACYVVSQITIVYLVVFLGFYIVPEKWQGRIYEKFHWSCEQFVGERPDQAVAIDLGLLALFALQHSVMARPTFKRVWTKIVPQPIERSTYVLLSSACLWLLFWQWRPVVEQIWPAMEGPLAARDSIARPIFQTVFWLGIGLALVSTFLVDHFALFGLSQTWAYFRGRELPAPQFRTPFLYRYVRHPLMLGFLMAFWSTPVMTLGRLIFAVVMTLYILVAIWLEERNLAEHFGEPYLRWKSQTSMLLPLRRPK